MLFASPFHSGAVVTPGPDALVVVGERAGVVLVGDPA